jgi:peptidoglycan/xylan/chitin deacetylase (PgdA/CDA1 family)
MMRAQKASAVSLLCLLSFYSLASCTTNQTAVDLLYLPKIEAHISEHSAGVRRTIASTNVEVGGEKSLESEFQQVLNSENPIESTKNQIDRLVRIFYRTQGLLNDYDAKTDELYKQGHSGAEPNGKTLQTDETYARLLSAWTIREEALSKIRYFYTRSLEIGMDRGIESKAAREQQDHALLMNKAFRETILSAPNSTNRLAKQDLISEMMQVNFAFHDYQLAHDQQMAEVTKQNDAFNGLLEKQLIEDSDDLQKFYDRNAAQLKRETQGASGDVELNSELAKRTPELMNDLADQYEQRTPQSNGGYAPGLGHKGMLSGMEFKTGRWALTFDDGPHPKYTNLDLANLKQAGIKTTFFWLAQNISLMKSIVTSAKEAGMTLGNHSWSHSQLTKLGAAGLIHEIDDSTKVDASAYGFKPKFFRCPYGACGSQTSVVRQKIAEQGMISVIWNVDSLDWQDHNPASIYARVKKQMAVQKKGIILFHDIHPQSVAASKMIMADFVAGEKIGKYRAITMGQALEELNSAEGMK